MKVLAANKFYFVKGGAERYFFELARILKGHGHDVVPFAMEDERNEESEHADLFVSHEAFEDGDGACCRLRAAGRVVYSVEARRKIEALVDRTRPDVAHLHNIAHQLSPSIIRGLAGKNVPVVQTLHDYKLVCPNYQMFVDGATCERCATWRYYNACVHRCMRGSFVSSALVCLEAYVHKVLGTYSRLVDLFIAPSLSLRDRMMAHGVDGEKIVHLPYAIALNEYEPDYGGEYAVYVGRLSTGKGLETLLSAAARAPGVRLLIIGDGPLGPELRARVELEGLANVEFSGYLQGDALRRAVSDALFVVVPSECYENSPLAVYEACALGKAVCGSMAGGIPELVVEGHTGVLFETGDSESLASRMRDLSSDTERTVEMGRAARARAESEYGPEPHYRRVMEIYERVAK